MPEDYRVKTSWRTSRKRKLLHRALGDRAVLAIMDLWSFAAAEKPDGDLSGMTDEEIAAEVDYPGSGADLVGELLKVGLMDGGEGARSLHDWGHHQPYNTWCAEQKASAKNLALRQWHERGAHHGKPNPECGLCMGIPMGTHRVDPCVTHGLPMLPSYLPSNLPSNLPSVQHHAELSESTPPPPAQEISEEQPAKKQAPADLVIGHYLERPEHTRSRYPSKTSQGYLSLRQRLKQGYSPDELCSVIDSVHSDEWCVKVGKLDLAWCMREDTVEKHLATRALPQVINHKTPTRHERAPGETIRERMLREEAEYEAELEAKKTLEEREQDARDEAERAAFLSRWGMPMNDYLLGKILMEQRTEEWWKIHDALEAEKANV